MSTYTTPLPPPVETGKYLSAYWVNQLGEYVNNAGNFVYGANVPMWTNPTTTDLVGEPSMYVLKHKYDTLTVKIAKGAAAMDAGIRLSKRDDYLEFVQPSPTKAEDDSYLTMTLSLDSIAGSFPLAEDELYFVYVNVDNDGGVSRIFEIGEYGTGLIVAPSPALDTLVASSVISEAYLNSLRTAALNLGQYTVPTNLPFAGIASASSWTGADCVYQWRVKHLSRYLHYSFLTPPNNNTIKIYKDGVEQIAYSNQISQWITDKLDLNAVSVGTFYDIKVTYSNAGSGVFKLYYMWELPYL